MLMSTNLPTSGDYDVLTKSKIATLNKRMKKRVNELKRIENRWDVTQKHAAYLEDITESKNPSQWRTKPSYKPSKYPKIEGCTSTIGFYFLLTFVLKNVL